MFSRALLVACIAVAAVADCDPSVATCGAAAADDEVAMLQTKDTIDEELEEGDATDLDEVSAYEMAFEEASKPALTQKLCENKDLPEAAAKRASAAAVKAAESKTKKLVLMADKVREQAKKTALQVLKERTEAAKEQRLEDVSVAESTHEEMVEQATAKAGAQEVHENAQIHAALKKAEKEAIMLTKDQMDAIQKKHDGMLTLAQAAADKQITEGAVLSKVMQAKKQESALEETRRAYMKAAGEYKLKVKDIQQEAGDKLQKVKAQTVMDKQDGQRAAEIKKEQLVKIAEEKFSDASRMAKAENTAAVSAADSERKRQVAESSAKGKVAEMDAWVNMFNMQMDNAASCEDDAAADADAA